MKGAPANELQKICQKQKSAHKKSSKKKKNCKKSSTRTKTARYFYAPAFHTHLGQNVEKVAGDAVVAQPIGGGRRIDVQRFERVPQALPEFLHLLVHASLIRTGDLWVEGCVKKGPYKIGGLRNENTPHILLVKHGSNVGSTLTKKRL
jgi:hypothetical protein